MKPVYCVEIAVGECEDLGAAPQGSQRDWSRFSVVFLGVTSQRQLGIRRNLPVIPFSAAVVEECLVWSLISTEDCGRLVTWHNLMKGLLYS